MTQKIKKVCKCENCGNESEMVVTCSLPSEEEQSTAGPVAAPADDPPPKTRVRGTATCEHCGNEADMWIDL